MSGATRRRRPPSLRGGGAALGTPVRAGSPLDSGPHACPGRAAERPPGVGRAPAGGAAAARESRRVCGRGRRLPGPGLRLVAELPGGEAGERNRPQAWAVPAPRSPTARRVVQGGAPALGRTGWEGRGLRDRSVPIPLPWLLRAPPNLALNIPRDGASSTSQDNLCQCLTAPTVENILC